MVEKSDLAQVIRSHPVEASEALKSIQAGAAVPITLEACAAVANVMLDERDKEDIAVDALEKRDLLVAYAHALKARGIPIDDEELRLEGAVFNFDAM